MVDRSEVSHTALAVASRRRLLELVRGSADPLDVRSLAAEVGLHVTTARLHLDVLQRAGLIRRIPDRAGRRGRPRQLYTAVDVRTADGRHQDLARALVETAAADTHHGPQWAELVGEQWAERDVPAESGLSWDAGTRRIAEFFAELGFAPCVVDDDQGRHIELYACPFRDLARTYPEIVCTVHLGLLRGALGQFRVPSPEASTLRPFVEPELCVADIPAD